MLLETAPSDAQVGVVSGGSEVDAVLAQKTENRGEAQALSIKKPAASLSSRAPAAAWMTVSRRGGPRPSHRHAARTRALPPECRLCWQTRS